MRTWLLMFKRYLIAFALIAGLATPANAQSPAPWTKVGMLRCMLDPSIGFIITGHESMQCSFAQSAGGPQAYDGAINMVGLDVISTAAGAVLEWAVFAPTYSPARAPAGVPVCWRFRRPGDHCWRFNQCPHRRVGTHLRPAAGLAGGIGSRQSRPRNFRSQAARRSLVPQLIDQNSCAHGEARDEQQDRDRHRDEPGARRNRRPYHATRSHREMKSWMAATPSSRG